MPCVPQSILQRRWRCNAFLSLLFWLKEAGWFLVLDIQEADSYLHRDSSHPRLFLSVVRSFQIVQRWCVQRRTWRTRGFTWRKLSCATASAEECESDWHSRSVSNQREEEQMTRCSVSYVRGLSEKIVAILRDVRGQVSLMMVVPGSTSARHPITWKRGWKNVFEMDTAYSVLKWPNMRLRLVIPSVLRTLSWLEQAARWRINVDWEAATELNNKHSLSEIWKFWFFVSQYVFLPSTFCK